MITLLRNAALNSAEYKAVLARMREQNIDITNFETSLDSFRTGFAKNYDLASCKFKSAIAGVDKCIKRLHRVKESLLGSENNLRLVNNKVKWNSVNCLYQLSTASRRLHIARVPKQGMPHLYDEQT